MITMKAPPPPPKAHLLFLFLLCSRPPLQPAPGETLTKDERKNEMAICSKFRKELQPGGASQ